jgi:hypothetical protein
MKQKIEDIIEETGYKENRAAKMNLNVILRYVCSPSMGYLMLICRLLLASDDSDIHFA